MGQQNWIERNPAMVTLLGGPLLALLILGAITQFDLAKKAYVDKSVADVYAKIAELDAATKIRIAEIDAAAKLRETAVRELSFDHSDRNHEDVLSRMKDVASDNKLLSQKFDSMIDRLKAIEENTRKGPRK